MDSQELLNASFSYGVEYLDKHGAWWPLKLDEEGRHSVPAEQTARNIAERCERETYTRTRVVLIETYVSVI